MGHRILNEYELLVPNLLGKLGCVLLNDWPGSEALENKCGSVWFVEAGLKICKPVVGGIDDDRDDNDVADEIGVTKGTVNGGVDVVFKGASSKADMIGGSRLELASSGEKE